MGPLTSATSTASLALVPFTTAIELATAALTAMAGMTAVPGIGSLIPSLIPAFGGGLAGGVANVGAGQGIAGLIEGASFFARGGIVTNPTLGVLAERGPEAVVPLRDMHKYTGGGQTVINFTVNTPDVAGFRQSENQIVRNLNMALRRSQGRDM
jgi:hypothetical protein